MKMVDCKCENGSCPVDNFEFLVRESSKDPVCPKCGTPAKRLPPQFSIATQNRYQTIDRIIGADAEKRWETVHRTQAEKEKRIKEGTAKRPEKVFVQVQSTT